jgi:hypothetical protein
VELAAGRKVAARPQEDATGDSALHLLAATRPWPCGRRLQLLSGGLAR